MAKKSNNSVFVFSTDPDFRGFEETSENAMETIPADQQKLLVQSDKKNRGGKLVTLVTGFMGTEADAQALGKKLKTFCGTGGSVKDNAIMVQGDNRDKVLQWLLKNSYKKTRKL
ncbi:translation initiation factor [soil metagenome]